MKCRWTGCTGSVDLDQVVVHRSMVDHGRRRSKGSSERGLGAAPVGRSLLAVREKEEGAPGVPTVGEGGRYGGGVRRATMNGGGGGRWSMGTCYGAGRGEKSSRRSCG
jgi:hypothetical protein